VGWLFCFPPFFFLFQLPVLFGYLCSRIHTILFFLKHVDDFVRLNVEVLLTGIYLV